MESATDHPPASLRAARQASATFASSSPFNDMVFPHRGELSSDRTHRFFEIDMLNSWPPGRSEDDGKIP